MTEREPRTAPPLDSATRRRMASGATGGTHKARPSLTDFLLARIAEDEGVAREAIPGTYSPNADDDGSWRMIEIDHEGIWPEPTSRPTLEPGHLADEPWAVHVERFDPARVLAECEAKRRIVERVRLACVASIHSPSQRLAREALAGVLEVIALPYADHPDYREEWRP